MPGNQPGKKQGFEAKQYPLNEQERADLTNQRQVQAIRSVRDGRSTEGAVHRQSGGHPRGCAKTSVHHSGYTARHAAHRRS